MNNTTPPFHIVLRLTGKIKNNSSMPSKQIEEKPKENPLKTVFTDFQNQIKERKFEVNTCSVTNNLVKISFCNYSRNSYELDHGHITKRLVECFENNLDQIAEIEQTLNNSEAKLEVEMSDKFTMFLMFFKEFKEALLNHSWLNVSFHWSKKNGLSTRLIVETPGKKGETSIYRNCHNCDHYAVFIEQNLKTNQYDKQHFEITRKKCSIKLRQKVESRN